MQKNDPILINIPHSSTYIPPEEAGYFTKGYQKIKVWLGFYLFAGACYQPKLESLDFTDIPATANEIYN